MTTSPRYRVVFTPVGWQVIDTLIAHDALYEFGTGAVEYQRAQDESARLNREERAA